MLTHDFSGFVRFLLLSRVAALSTPKVHTASTLVLNWYRFLAHQSVFKALGHDKRCYLGAAPGGPVVDGKYGIGHQKDCSALTLTDCSFGHVAPRKLDVSTKEHVRPEP
jgi:hypothetical protein